MYFRYGNAVLKGRPVCSAFGRGVQFFLLGAAAHFERIADVQPGPVTTVPTPGTAKVTGVSWLMSNAPISLVPWLPTYPTSMDRLFVRDLCRSRSQVST